MENTIPWVLITIGGILVVLLAVMILLGRKRSAAGKRIFSDIHKKAFLTQFTIGLVLCLGGAYLMFDGEILGDETAGIARIFGIIGIAILATAAPIGLAVKKRF